MVSDLNILQKLGAHPQNDPRCLLLGETELQFSAHPGQTGPEPGGYSLETLSHQAGWRRFSLQGPPIRELVEFFTRERLPKGQGYFLK